MVTGGPGFGKSSLICRLFGKAIPLTHEPTNALETKRNCCEVNITAGDEVWRDLIGTESSFKKSKFITANDDDGTDEIDARNDNQTETNDNDQEMINPIENDEDNISRKDHSGVNDNDSNDCSGTVRNPEINEDNTKLTDDATSKSHPTTNDDKILRDQTKPKRDDSVASDSTAKFTEEDDNDNVIVIEKGETNQAPPEGNKYENDEENSMETIGAMNDTTHGHIVKDDEFWETGIDKAKLFVWDFGGQEMYVDMHHIFLRPNCVHIVVFKLNELSESFKTAFEECKKKVKDLNMDEIDVKKWILQDHKSQFRKFTNEKVHSWLERIQAVSFQKESEGSSRKEDMNPNIILVGTHKDRLIKCDECDKKQKLESSKECKTCKVMIQFIDYDILKRQEEHIENNTETIYDRRDRYAEYLIELLKETQLSRHYKHRIGGYYCIKQTKIGEDEDKYKDLRKHLVQSMTNTPYWNEERSIHEIYLLKKLFEQTEEKHSLQTGGEEQSTEVTYHYSDTQHHGDRKHKDKSTERTCLSQDNDYKENSAKGPGHSTESDRKESPTKGPESSHQEHSIEDTGLSQDADHKEATEVAGQSPEMYYKQHLMERSDYSPKAGYKTEGQEFESQSHLNKSEHHDRFHEAARFIFSFKEIEDIAKAQIGESHDVDLRKFLDFHNKTGDLTFFPDLDLVVLDPQWLTNVVRAIITLPEYYPKDPDVQDDVIRLRDEAVIHKDSPLFDRCWEKILTERVKTDNLKSIMCNLNLMFKYGKHHYLIPCLLKENKMRHKAVQSSGKHSTEIELSPIAIYFKFHASRMARKRFEGGLKVYDEILPPAMFPRLVCWCVTKSKWNPVTGEDQYRNLFTFECKNDFLELSMSPTWIKLSPLTYHGEPALSRIERRPFYLDNIRSNIEELLQTQYPGVWYEMCVNPCQNIGEECIKPTGIIGPQSISSNEYFFPGSSYGSRSNEELNETDTMKKDQRRGVLCSKHGRVMAADYYGSWFGEYFYSTRFLSFLAELNFRLKSR